MAQPRRNRKSPIMLYSRRPACAPLRHVICLWLVNYTLTYPRSDFGSATDKCGRQAVSVELRVVNFHDPHPTRAFVLRSPTYAIRIGRGSKSGNRELFPASYNAWFDSRVMSREHAVLKADPDTRVSYPLPAYPAYADTC